MKLQWLPRLVTFGTMAAVGLAFVLMTSGRDRIKDGLSKLDRRVTTHLDFAALSTAIQQLSEKSGLTILPDWKALNDAGLREDSFVTVHFDEARVSKTLQYILDVATPDESAREIFWHLRDDGSVLITTTRNAKDFVIERRYNIRGYTQAMYGTYGPDSSSGRELENSIVKLVTDTIASHTWKANGGSFGEIRSRDGYLFITQSPENQRSVVHLFELLNEGMATDWLRQRQTVSQRGWGISCFPAPSSASQRP